MFQSKVSEEKIQFFAREMARKAVEKHGFSSGKISGEQIMAFHAHRQVNLFALFQVYQDLTQQLSELLRSGYQTENEEVREAVKKFQNTLSRHIFLGPVAFQEILEKAIYNNIKLIFHPDETMEKFFFSAAEIIPVEMFQMEMLFCMAYFTHSSKVHFLDCA